MIPFFFSPTRPDYVLCVVLVGCCYCISLGLVKLWSFGVAHRRRLALSEYRASVLLAEARREVRRRA